MHAVELVFAVVWGAFWLYWLIAAFSTKRGQVPWSRELGFRAVIVVIVVLLIRARVFRYHALDTDPWREGVGWLSSFSGSGSPSGPTCTSGATGARP